MAFKYDEDKLLNEVADYISQTYQQHYSKGNVQTLDLIDSVGDAEAFCRSNILKYASRYDRKGSARKDIVKIVAKIVCFFFHQNLMIIDFGVLMDEQNTITC